MKPIFIFELANFNKTQMIRFYTFEKAFCDMLCIWSLISFAFGSIGFAFPRRMWCHTSPSGGVERSTGGPWSLHFVSPLSSCPGPKKQFQYNVRNVAISEMYQEKWGETFHEQMNVPGCSGGLGITTQQHNATKIIKKLKPSCVFFFFKVSEFVKK